jgi:hypothetical protein
LFDAAARSILPSGRAGRSPAMVDDPVPAPPLRARRLSPWIWLAVPVAIVLLQVGAKAVGEDVYRRTMRGELGLVENLTVLFLVVAIVSALRLLPLRRRVAWRWFGAFAAVMALGCFFFAGEEASWGQHWLGFEPPEAIAERNDQGEFNLHNDPLLEKVLDQLPRLALTLAALIGGVIAPIVRRGRRGHRGRRPRFDGPGLRGWIWPTVECVPAALLATTISVPGRIIEKSGGEIPYLMEISAGETKEFGLGLFLMVYLVTLRRALAASPGR